MGSSTGWPWKSFFHASTLIGWKDSADQAATLPLIGGTCLDDSAR
jgi:hypothetical protein